jgi:hypothetical protein
MQQRDRVAHDLPRYPRRTGPPVSTTGGHFHAQRLGASRVDVALRVPAQHVYLAQAPARWPAPAGDFCGAIETRSLNESAPYLSPMTGAPPQPEPDGDIMKYRANFQYQPRNSDHILYEQTIENLGSEDDRFIAIPNIGDHVCFMALSNDPEPKIPVRVVKNRQFVYMADLCFINIVVTDYDTDLGLLIKE